MLTQKAHKTHSPQPNQNEVCHPSHSDIAFSLHGKVSGTPNTWRHGLLLFHARRRWAGFGGAMVELLV
jgi:hypothetical protein